MVRRVRLRSDLDSERGVRSEVADPVGSRTPGRADDHPTCLAVVGECHRDRLARLARVAADVSDHEKDRLREPAPPASVERAGQTHGLKRETAGLFPKPEQRPVPVVSLVRSAVMPSSPAG